MSGQRTLKSLLITTLVLLLAVTACSTTASNTPQPSATTATEPTATTAAEAAPTTASQPTATTATEATPTAASEPAATTAAEATPTAASEPTATMPAGVRTFVVLPDQSSAGYEVDEQFFAGALGQLGIQAGKVKTVGNTSQITGQLALDFSGPLPTLDSGQFTVDISTLTSDQSRRDNQIRNRWLESGRFPQATFTASGIENAPASFTEGQPVNFQLTGDLKIRDVTNPETFDVTATLAGDTITGTATTSIKMTDFGFDPPDMAGLLTVGDQMTIVIDLTMQEQ